jgi:hypothetical protein
VSSDRPTKARDQDPLRPAVLTRLTTSRRSDRQVPSGQTMWGSNDLVANRSPSNQRLSHRRGRRRDDSVGRTARPGDEFRQSPAGRHGRRHLGECGVLRWEGSTLTLTMTTDDAARWCQPRRHRHSDVDRNLDDMDVIRGRTAPAITALITVGTLGVNGWYTGPVTAHFVCADPARRQRCVLRPRAHGVPGRRHAHR